MKNRFLVYGIEKDIVEVTNVDKTEGSEIIDKNTIQGAIDDGLKLAADRTPEDAAKYKQIVTVLENIRSTLENGDEPVDDKTIKIAKTSVDAILKENNLAPLEETDNLKATQESICRKIEFLKHISLEDFDQNLMNDNMNAAFYGLSKLFPLGYQTVYFYAFIAEGSYSMIFYVHVDGKLINCFDLDKHFRITSAEIRNTFAGMHRLLLPLKKMAGFDVMKATIHNSGKITNLFEYDVTENSLQHQMAWVKELKSKHSL